MQKKFQMTSTTYSEWQQTTSEETQNQEQDHWLPIISALESQNRFLPKNWTQKNFSSLIAEKNSHLAEVISILSNRDLNDPVGVFLAGGAGCGKTHLILSTMSRLAWFYWHLNKGLNNQIKFWNYSDLCGVIRQEPNNFELLHKLRSPAYLFIDDLGTSKSTDFVQEKIYSIFNYRVENELPTFVTTNLSMSDINREFSERMGSRIKESCAWIELKATKDYRSNIFLQNMQKYKNVISK